MTHLVVIGSAPCVSRDLAALEGVDADFMVINRAGISFNRDIKWWATYHPSLMSRESWLERRREHGGNMDFKVVLHQHWVPVSKVHPNVVVIEGPRLTGSSTLFGVLFGLLEANYDMVTIAGAPLDDAEYAYYRDGWVGQADILAGRVRSMSGWTKTFLEDLHAALETD